ncbi:hypothetical protein SELMODRAFT_411419 [Selaginella moellendorffii]|uniref:Uncharacterized protein n=1 Tax=Selaginella moellendorffii TaxID=88036 RepID=D8RHV4_SELML|nr:hypothetical protein SELMODRAFT_411419 [Selaginella moellendorffii]
MGGALAQVTKLLNDINISIGDENMVLAIVSHVELVWHLGLPHYCIKHNKEREHIEGDHILVLGKKAMFVDWLLFQVFENNVQRRCLSKMTRDYAKLKINDNYVDNMEECISTVVWQVLFNEPKQVFSKSIQSSSQSNSSSASWVNHM